MHRLLNVLVLVLGLALAFSLPGAANAHAPQEEAGDAQVSALEQRVEALERQVRGIEDEIPGAGLALFLTACFCALWGQNTGRSAWLWFFLGLFFNVFALLALLYKNSRDDPMTEDGRWSA